MKFTQEQREEQAEKAMYSFNFEKVHEHMVNTNHKWVMGDERTLWSRLAHVLRAA